jgi:hypothetical protein
VWRRKLKLLAATMKWISRYEQWVIETRGLNYRRRCLADWTPEACPAEQVAEEWRNLAARCETLL